MYTQCPDCNTAFRVTADVLKQAAGKVRCGGCGIAFNALEYLSEAMPERPATREDEVPLPELTPEPREPKPSTPKAISARQSAALLKTLDDLAGSDIRIEDTGVEWRVLDDEAEDDTPEAGGAAASPGVDELLDESPTPVDQFLTKTPNQIEAGEIFEESANAPAQTRVDELRFDDNTPLPHDFDLDDASSYRPEAPDAGAETEAALQTEHPRDIDDSPVDIALGDADEWADILGEFAEPLEPYVPPLEAELSALEEVLPEGSGDAEENDTPPDAELSAPQETPSADVGEADLSAAEEIPPGHGSDAEPADAEERDNPPDMDTQFALQAEAMGIDLSGLHATSETTAEQTGDEARDTEASAASETDRELDDEPQLDAAREAAEQRLAEADEVLESAPVDETAETGEVPELELDDDDAATPELEHELAEGPETAPVDETAETGEVPELELDDDDAARPELEHEPAEGPEMAPVDETAETGEVPELELDDDDAATELEHEPAEGPETALDLEEDDATRRHEMDEMEDVDEAPLEFGSMEKAMAELEEQSDVFEKNFFTAGDEDEPEIEVLIEDDDIVPDDDIGSGPSISGDDKVHVVPEPSDEEQTLNLLIDQELLSMAVEDEDGFASTIVVAEEDAEDVLAEVREQQASDDADAGFESIVMEGEFVSTALGQEKLKADIAAAAALAEQADLAEAAAASKTGAGRRRGMAAAAVVLVLLLVVQVLHQSREALATIPAFNDAIGPLYRAIGLPLSPAWDVTGWRFEARRDILDEEADTLTVISRIGNTSAKPLPYPLINISLTDRFEEIVGTRTLAAGDYLADDLDPGKMVRPGNNFTAVMTIDSPSRDATGYKLQACYRQPDSQLRCHIPNFK